jgi:large subunit ribosomal protein L6
MSRIGKLPIALGGVDVKVKGSLVTVKGPRGEATLELPDGIGIEERDGLIHVTRSDDSTGQRSMHGTVRALLSNKVVGVSKGHSITLIVQGKGYQAEMKGIALEMQLGFSHRIVVTVPEGISVDITPGQNTFTLQITGNDRHLVGDFASVLYGIKPVEPYNLIGFRYSDQFVKRKAAKTVVT